MPSPPAKGSGFVPWFNDGEVTISQNSMFDSPETAPCWSKLSNGWNVSSSRIISSPLSIEGIWPTRKCGGNSSPDPAETVVRQLAPVNLSKGLLETFPLQNPSSLAVLPIRGVYWSDWGSIYRVVNDLREMGCLGRHGLIEENEYLVA
ncbi:MAG: hypothetical protein WBK96_14460 [Candidatus Manganitrophaceae bacterium]